MSELTNPIEQHQTPYDTGDRMEPRPWITHQVVEQLRAGRVPLNAEALDHFGRVDFDDDEGTTIATLHIEGDPLRPEVAFLLKLDVNAPVIIHGPGGEYIGTVNPM